MEYESISYAEGLLIMTKYRFTNSGPVGRDGLYDLKGNVVYSASHYSDQTIRLLDKENKLLLIGSWVGGSVGSRLGIFDLQLNQLTPVDYDEVRPLSNGCYQLSKRSGSGSSIFGIFKLGKGVIIPCEYSNIRSFGGELFTVSKGDSGITVVDEQCKQVIPGTYDSVLDLKNGYLAAGRGGKVGVVDFAGATVVPFAYETIDLLDNGEVHASVPSGQYYIVGTINGVPSYAEGYKTETFYLEIPPFRDVAVSQFFFDPVKWAIEQGITTGTSGTTFSPNATCTRAQILTFLWRAKGAPQPSGANPFSDVAANAYYADAAAWAAEMGLVSGSALQGDTPCTRSEVMTYLWQLAGSPKTVGLSFRDVDVSAPYADAVSWAVQNQITNGTSSTTFSPESTCTRGQIVTFLYRAYAA